jgi:hypothetical protein
MTPLEELRAAINDFGPHPMRHLRIMDEHRKEWPTLWNAINRLLEVEVVGRFDVKGTPGTVQDHEAEQFIPDPWEAEHGGSYRAQLFSSYETIDSGLPEGEYWVVKM